MKIKPSCSVGNVLKRILIRTCGVLAILTVAAQAGQLHGHVPEAVSHLSATGRLAATKELRLAICLPLRNQGVLSNLLQQLYDPASPSYRHYLNPDQFTEQFGPTEADYQAVIAFATEKGLKVTDTYPNRTIVDVSGKVADIEKAFHTTLRIYPHPQEARKFYAPDVEPLLDLKVPVLHIIGLDDYSLPRPRLQKRSAAGLPISAPPQPNGGSGPSGTYMANDFRAAYVPGTSLTGAGQAVGLVQFDGYSASDIAYYIATNHLSSVTISNVLLDGFTGTPTGSGGEVEVCLDIEMVLSMAPGISAIYVYEAGPFGLWQDILNRMVNDNVAKQLSCSWYIPGGGMDSVADGIFEQMAAQGQSFYSASGDYDAYCGLISFPGDTPYITQVGGTFLNTSGPGGMWTSETAWNRNNGIGSGGGISTQYAIPTWQQGLSMVANQGSTTMRNVPDVALTADYVYVRSDDLDLDVGGTSAAAPLWAGFTALVNQRAVTHGRAVVGFVNPALYAIGQRLGSDTRFHDITVGNNTNSSCSVTLFPAVAGYDLATGWGSPTLWLIDSLAGPADPLQIHPLTGFTSSGGVGGPFTATSQTLTLTNAGTNFLTWSLVNTSLWLSASSAGGTLTPGGAVTTVIVGLNSAASNLVVGTYVASLVFSNVTDSVGQSAQYTLIVFIPPTDWFTELFSTSAISNVMAFKSFTYTPNDGANSYAVCGVPAQAFATDPAGGTVLVEGDDTFVPITLSGTNTVAIYTNRSNKIFVGSNGYLTLNAGDVSYSPTYAQHFSYPRVAAAFRDLNATGLKKITGGISWKQTSDRIAVTYQNVPIYNSTTQTSSFQVEMFFNGVIRITYLTLNMPSALVGLSAGTGQSTNFVASDYTAYNCFQAPTILVQPANQTNLVGSTAGFTVAAGGSSPLSYFWSRNGVVISGATNVSYSTNNVQMADNGSQFTCLITNLVGFTNSQAAALTVVAPLVITQVKLLPNGTIQITMGTSIGDAFRILGSTNLVNWQTVAALTNLNGTVQFTDLDATGFVQRFYRLVLP